jgi:hypothetical protein
MIYELSVLIVFPFPQTMIECFHSIVFPLPSIIEEPSELFHNTLPAPSTCIKTLPPIFTVPLGASTAIFWLSVSIPFGEKIIFSIV